MTSILNPLRDAKDRRLPRVAGPCSLILFGVTGDLARKKLIPAVYDLANRGLLPPGFALVGFARQDFGHQEFKALIKRAAKDGARTPWRETVWKQLVAGIRFVPGEFDDDTAWERLGDTMRELDEQQGTNGNHAFYLSIPPALFQVVVSQLKKHGLATANEGWRRVVIEKPFGHDLASARELNGILDDVFPPECVFRIDHYLGKETVQNILAFRFSNGLFEPVWNRRYLDHVQITVAESIGVGNRGAFYEQTGAIRDMIATHLFQVMTFLAMEPPVSFEPNRLRDETVKVLRSAKRIDPSRVVRGQYEGYRSEPDVGDDSTVETFAAMEVEIDSWRWSDVPFFLRTGKQLQAKRSEVTLKYRKVPYNVFRGTDVDLPRRDHLTIRIQPNEGMTIALNAKKPGPGLELGRVTMDFDYEREFRTQLVDSYQLLLLEAMEGDHTLFLRQDAVERAWELLMPVLEHPPPVIPYPKGSWGPEEADKLIAPRRWHMSTDVD